MNKIKTIVVDDEKPSRDALCTYIIDYCEGIDIVSQCDCVKSAHKAILQYKPSLVFLDIEMPNGNGFELLNLFNPLYFKVIFVTAFSEYAIKAFRFSAIDYLLKPVKVDELVESVKKVHHELDQQNNPLNILTLLENIKLQDQPLNKLVIPDNKGFTVINISDLILCEADGYCTHFHQTGKQKVTSSKNLKYYEELLSKHLFLRVHQSYLVNLDHVKNYSHQGTISLTDDELCPLGSSYKMQFLAIFNKLK